MTNKELIEQLRPREAILLARALNLKDEVEIGHWLKVAKSRANKRTKGMLI